MPISTPIDSLSSQVSGGTISQGQSDISDVAAFGKPCFWENILLITPFAVVYNLTIATTAPIFRPVVSHTGRPPVLPEGFFFCPALSICHPCCICFALCVCHRQSVIFKRWVCQRDPNGKTFRLHEIGYIEPLIDLVMSSTPSRMTLLQLSVVSYGRQTTAIFGIYDKLEVGGDPHPYST